MKPILIIEGIIGAGKSTLSKHMSKVYNMHLLEEPYEDDILELFYSNPEKYAFTMQMKMMMERYKLHQLASYESITNNQYSGIILDRSLPGDTVFCRLQHKKGFIEPAMYKLYCDWRDMMLNSIQPPSVLIYLDIDVENAFNRVKIRNRSQEVNKKLVVDIEYLSELKECYEELIHEIESGKHYWGRGMKVKRLDWNKEINFDTDDISECLTEIGT